jgi:hypothetical protein
LLVTNESNNVEVISIQSINSELSQGTLETRYLIFSVSTPTLSVATPRSSSGAVSVFSHRTSSVSEVQSTPSTGTSTYAEYCAITYIQRRTIPHLIAELVLQYYSLVHNTTLCAILLTKKMYLS